MEKKINFILCLFSALLAYGQVTLVVSDVKDPKVNQKFNLTVMLEISGENMLQETPLRMPDLSKFDIIGSASEQNTVVLDAKKGDVLNQMIYQLVLSPKQAGKIKFGSVLVTVNGKIYKTEPFDINVRDSEKSSSVAENTVHHDVYLNMEIQDRSVYKNEPTIAVLRAYSRDYGNFRKVGNIQYSKQKNIRIKPVSFAKSEIETNSGLASQVIAVFMIFPSESGSIDINPVSASVSKAAKSEKISSNRVRLHVKKLPVGMPTHYKNAVGKFEVSVVKNNPDEVPEVEKPVNITVKVSGSGNFETVQLPKVLDSENYIFFPPKITSNTVAEKNGLSGSITADYVVIPKKYGPITISLEHFSFFDPNVKKYIDLGSQSLLIDVKTHQQIADAKSTIERVNDYTNNVLETVNTPVLQTHNLKIKDKDRINWKIVFGNIALLIGVLSVGFVIRRKMEQRKLQAVKMPGKPVTTIGETEEIIRGNFQVKFEDNIRYLKNLADNKDFSKFFTAYDDLHSDTKKHLRIESEAEFKKYLETNRGLMTADEYRKLSEKIKIEKYAPYHTPEHISELLNSIERLYSDIKQ